MYYFKLSTKQTLKLLNTKETGLTEKEVLLRQKKYGKNKIKIHKEVSFPKLLLEQTKNYLTILLIILAIFAFTTGIIFKSTEQIIDGIIITFIIIVNVFVGAYQSYKSEKTAQLLSNMLKTYAIVIRNNKKQKIDSEELVPGDIILLKEGDKVPADCRILESKDLYTNESSLTGESKSILKDSKTLKTNKPLAERTNMVYMNTYVVRGSAKCVVTQTGIHTEVGKISKSLELEKPSPFIKEVDTASKKITYVALIMILIVSLIYFINNHNWISTFMIASALIIGAIPEGLPAIITFALSLGSLHLAKNKVLVKKKSLLETLGSVDIICTDKTGTLTENKMTVKKIFINNQEHNNLDNISPSLLKTFSMSALLTNEAKDTNSGFQGNPEDLSLIKLFNTKNISITELRKKYESIHFSPFSSETMYSLSINRVNNNNITYIKGAPEVILKKSKYILLENKIKPLDEKEKNKIKEKLSNFSKNALRNIAFAYKPQNKKDFIFIGFVGMYDKPKNNINKSIKTLYNAGIDVKMITGDNKLTAESIAEECGFRNIKSITWNELKDMTNEELKTAVEKHNIFARISPEFKLKIVSALQESGHRVAITGDGVNDVPALKKAEVGIAMGRGTDIAKESADMILLDDNFPSVIKGIKTGRTIFVNVRKVINYLLTANLAEVFVVFLGSLWNVTPFQPIQLLWVNFVTDVAPAMALASDKPKNNIMKLKPTGKNEKLINKRITLLTVFIGLKKVVLIFLLFFLTYYMSKSLILAQTVSFTWLVMSHFVRIAAIRFDEKENLFMNKYVNIAVLIPVLLQILIIYTPLSRYFQVVPLKTINWVLIITSFIIAIALAKLITLFIDFILEKNKQNI